LEMESDIECCRTECSEVKEQFQLTNSIRIWDIILEMELDIECCRREFSEVNEQFQMKKSIRFGDIISGWN